MKLKQIIDNKIYLLKRNEDLNIKEETTLEELEDQFESLSSRKECLKKLNQELDDFISNITYKDMKEHY